MTLVLEVIQPDGSRARHRLGELPLTLGRGLANDVVLDDPYVDATHARLTLNGDGVIVEDLGSVNGVVARQQRAAGSIVARPGDVLRIGRTILRVRATNESLPPALVERSSPEPVPPRPLNRWPAPASAGFVSLVIVVSALALNAWLNSAARSSASDAMSASIGAAVLICLWAGLWSLASRMIVHQFRFMEHLAIASASVLVGLAWNIAQSWFTFFFPDSALVTFPAFLFWLALLAALVAGHLSLASTMSRRHQWRAGAVVSGVVVAIAALAALAKDDTFSDVPKFAAVVKPVPARWVPTKSIAQFEDVSRELRSDVDQLAKK